MAQFRNLSHLTIRPTENFNFDLRFVPNSVKSLTIDAALCKPFKINRKKQTEIRYINELYIDNLHFAEMLKIFKPISVLSIEVKESCTEKEVSEIFNALKQHEKVTRLVINDFQIEAP